MNDGTGGAQTWDQALDDMAERLVATQLLLGGQPAPQPSLSDLEALGPLTPEQRARATDLHIATEEMAARVTERLEALNHKMVELRTRRDKCRPEPAYVDRRA